MAAEIEERERTLDEFLADQTNRLLDDMAECREKFRVALKKLYNYKDYQVPHDGHDENDEHHGQYSYQPYSHYQHKNFIYKFKQYLAEELAQLDVQLLAIQDSTAVQVANISEQAAS